jgi:outer membrane protein OmpA-like peptidoglycan-associated protein
MKKIYLFLVLSVALSNDALAQAIKEQTRVYFNFNSPALTDRAIATLDSLLGTFRQGEEPLLKLELFGHCDTIGSFKYNDTLSKRRVYQVAQYLLLKGIADSFLVTQQGLGKRQPLVNNSNEQNRQFNRRVEIWVYRQPIPVKPQPPPAPLNEPEPLPVRRESMAALLDNRAPVGSIIRLENLNFYGGRHILLPQSFATLRALLKLMLENPALEIEIHGHVCCTPPDFDGRDNDTNTNNLSVNRARAIYDFLIENGIDTNRMSYRGFGAKYPLVAERTEEDRSTNRRVEIKIVKK